jgi:PDZ domain-containing protein
VADCRSTLAALLAAFASVATPTILAAASPAAAAVQGVPSPPVRLLFTKGADEEPRREALELLREKLRILDEARSPSSGEARDEVRPLAPAGGTAGEEAREGHLGLAVYRSLREARVGQGFAVEFRDETGLLRLYGFDAQRGVDATAVLKIENDKGRRRDHGEKGEKGERGERDDEEDEQRERIGHAVDSFLGALAAEGGTADAADAAQAADAVRWLGDEDPIDLGFRWCYVAAGGASLAQVTLVLDTSALGRADLRRGDSILAIDGRAVASPPLFGRVYGGLKAGAPLELTVRRGGETLAIAGKVERASEVVPAYEQKAVGAKLPPFTASIGGAPVAIGGEKPAEVTVVCLFDPRRPDTLRDAAVLEWLRDRFPKEQVAIAAIAVHGDAATTAETMGDLACGWPAAADPDGRLTDATRTLQLPALLVAGRDGVVRQRPQSCGELQRAVKRRLAGKH